MIVAQGPLHVPKLIWAVEDPAPAFSASSATKIVAL